LKLINQLIIKSNTKETIKKLLVAETPEIHSALIIIPVIEFIVDLRLDIRTGFGFRNWHFIIVVFKFAVNRISYKVYINIRYFITLINRK